MANATLRFEGLEELRAELRKLPAELTDEATSIVLQAANETMDEVGAIYEEHTDSGNLRRGLTVRVAAAGPFGTGALVKSAAKHAWIFEHGSALRSYKSTNGKTHSTGQMWGRTSGPAHVFVRTAVRKRHDMVERLKALVRTHGLEVSGDG